MWNGEDRFTKDLQVKLCYDFSVNWRNKKCWVYSYKCGKLARVSSGEIDLRIAGR